MGGGVGAGGGMVWGVDMNEEVKFCEKMGGMGRGVRWGGQVGDRVGGGQGGCERNVGVRGDVGYGGCEPRIGGIVQCTKRYCTILRKLKKMCVWGGEGQYLSKNTLYVFKKEKEQKSKRKKKTNKKLTEPGLEPTTSGLKHLLSYPLG